MAKPPDNWWVKIGDFGISKRTASNMQAASSLKGTLGFVPPELHGFVDKSDLYLDDAQIATSAADIWSLGEILFQLLTNEPTFPNMGSLYEFVRGTIPFPITVLNACNTSHNCQNLISQMMQPRPKKRIIVKDALEHTWMLPCKINSPEPLSLTFSE